VILWITAFFVLFALLVEEVVAEAPLYQGHASAYGEESIYDGGYWSDSEWRWVGYMFRRTSWGWHCSLPEHLDPESPYYAWAVLTPESAGVANTSWGLLGTWTEMRIQQPDGTWSERLRVPVTDAGPYGVWWTWDLQPGAVAKAGWTAIAPSRYGEREGPFYGRRDIQVRLAPEQGRFCPRLGYHEASG